MGADRVMSRGGAHIRQGLNMVGLQPAYLAGAEGPLVQAAMDEGFEIVPLSVELEASQLHDGFNALLDPPHAAVIAPPSDKKSGWIGCIRSYDLVSLNRSGRF